MPVELYVSVVDYAPEVAHSNLVPFEDDVDALIVELQHRYPGPFEALRGWTGLKALLQNLQHCNNCNVPPIDVGDLSKLSQPDALDCVIDTSSYVHWIVHSKLSDVLKTQSRLINTLSEKLGEHFVCKYPVVSQLSEIDEADWRLNRQTKDLHITDCRVIQEVERAQKFFDNMWNELKPLQKTLVDLAIAANNQRNRREQPKPEKRFHEIVLKGLGLSLEEQQQHTPLSVLFFSYILVNHSHTGWIRKLGCGLLSDFGHIVVAALRSGRKVLWTNREWVLIVALIAFGLCVLWFGYRSSYGIDLRNKDKHLWLSLILIGPTLVCDAIKLTYHKLKKTLNQGVLVLVVKLTLVVIVIPLLIQLTFIPLEQAVLILPIVYLVFLLLPGDPAS